MVRTISDILRLMDEKVKNLTRHQKWLRFIVESFVQDRKGFKRHNLIPRDRLLMVKDVKVSRANMIFYASAHERTAPNIVPSREKIIEVGR